MKKVKTFLRGDIYVDTKRIPEKFLKEFTSFSLPFDSTLALLRPLCPEWVVEWDNKEIEIEKITEFISALFESQKLIEPNKSILAFSIPLRNGKKEIAKLEVLRWAQWKKVPLDEKKLLEHFQNVIEHRTALIGTMGFASMAIVPTNDIDDIKEPVLSAAPLARNYRVRSRSYLHSDLYSCGIKLPIFTVKNTDVSLRPSQGVLDVLVNDEIFGRWNYWNVGCETCYPKELSAPIGALLMAETEKLNMLWDSPPVRHFMLWTCCIFNSDNRENPYTLKTGIFFDESIQ
jgi:hypothetical protein